MGKMDDTWEVQMGLNMTSDHDVISVQMMRVREGSIVLSIGVGQGVFTSYVARVWNAYAICIDTSERFLEAAKRRTSEAGVQRRVLLTHASGDRIPLRDGCIDAAISILTMHSLPPERIAQVFQELRRVLVKRGRFILVEDWASDPKCEVEHTLLELMRMPVRSGERSEYRLNYRDYVEILRRSGFEIEEIRFLPRRIFPHRLLDRFKSLKQGKAVELLQTVRDWGSNPIQVDSTLISSRAKR